MINCIKQENVVTEYSKVNENTENLEPDNSTEVESTEIRTNAVQQEIVTEQYKVSSKKNPGAKTQKETQSTEKNTIKKYFNTKSTI